MAMSVWRNNVLKLETESSIKRRIRLVDSHGLNIALPQSKKLSAEIVLQLNAMPIHGDIQVGKYVFAVQDAMALTDVEHFNGKHVSGVL